MLTNTTIGQNVPQPNNFENAYLVFEEELKESFCFMEKSRFILVIVHFVIQYFKLFHQL